MVRPRARTLLVAFALATLTMVLVAVPAHAIEVKQQTHLVAQFQSGHTGWVKIALERDSTDRARAHLGVWCQNASGATVACGATLYKAHESWLRVEHWSETYNDWIMDSVSAMCPANNDCNLLGVNQYTGWECTGDGNDQYRAVIYNVRIKDAFGELSNWKTRTHPTWLGFYC